MKCVSPPELDEMRLWTYVDGEADQETVHHLEKCEYCRGRVDELAKLRNRVGSRLYRINCPSTLELGEYHLGLLESSEKLVVAQHIRECRHCQGEIAQLEEYTKNLAKPPALKLIAQLINGPGIGQNLLEPSTFPIVTGVRGESEEPFIYQAKHIQIAIEVQDDTEQAGRKTLLGLITGLKSSGFMMEAYQDGKIVATTIVDKIGNFAFNHFLPGSYELILLGPDTEISIDSFIV